MWNTIKSRIKKCIKAPYQQTASNIAVCINFWTPHSPISNRRTFHLCEKRFCAKKTFLNVKDSERWEWEEKSIIFTSTYNGKSSWKARFYTGKAQRTLWLAAVLVRLEVKITQRAAWNLPGNGQALRLFPSIREKLFERQEEAEKQKERNQLVDGSTMESTFAVWTSVPCGMCRS